jgi:transcriptional regulator with XRE-family HTH domain
MTIQQSIRRRLRQMKISERELAYRMGCDRATVWGFLQADAQITLRTLRRIARALECEAKITLVPYRGGKTG